jgi:hypothetical protein
VSTQKWKDDHWEEMKEYRRRHYRRNKKQYRSNVKRRRIDLRIWIRELKFKLKCSQCPEDYPACLDFHHPGNKEKSGRRGHNDGDNVAALVQRGCSRVRILKEIEKCIVLCANCHRKLHDLELRGIR